MTNITNEELALFEKFKAMMQQEQDKKASKPIKRRRPKGSGSITKLSGNRSKPYVVNITLGHDEEDGRQIKKCLGTYATRLEAETALSAYNLHRNGYIGNKEYSNVVNSDVPTVAEIWKRVCEEEEDSIKHVTRLNYNTAYNGLKGIYDYRIDRLTLTDIQPLFDVQKALGIGKGKLEKMKLVLSKIYTYAIKYDYCNKDYSKFLNIEAESAKKVQRTLFTKQEIVDLFEDDSEISKVLRILLYTGMRPTELATLDRDKINIEEKYMIGGIKTKNGIDRTIPIHESIVDLVKEFKEEKILSNAKSKRSKYNYMLKIMNESKYRQNHTLYDCRHTFATMCNEFKLDTYLTKKILGHSCQDLTLDVYTHATVNRLVNEVNKIPTADEFKAMLDK